MRIAYLGQMADVTSENGISKKIRAQCHHWQSAGHQVCYFSLVRTNELWSAFSSINTHLVRRGTAVQRNSRSAALTKRIRAWQPDVIYFRYAYHSAGFPRLFRDIPTIAEINSDDMAEYPATLSMLKLVYHRITRAWVLNATRAFVPVTRELADRFAAFGKPAQIIANGIDLDSFPSAPATVLGLPRRLVFVGTTGAPWSGLDRVAELARLYPQHVIDVIGCSGLSRQESTTKEAAPANLHFHGALLRESYEPLIKSATAAIGTMALFRKNMQEACPLKVREYLAFGLPVIAGYGDTDIPENADYFLRLPNNSASLSPERDRILAFLDRWSQRRVPRASITHLDVSVKEDQRLEFMQRIAGPSSQ